MLNLKHPSFTHYIFLTLLLSGQFDLQAQVLECRDADGRKIFAQTCPRGSKQVKEVEILASPSNPTSTSASKSTASTSSLAEKEQAFKDRQNAKENEAEKERDRLRALESECFGHKQKLNNLIDGFPITVSKDAEGNPIFMDDAKRAELGKELTAKLKKCPKD